jgi:hypothetical protein
LISPPVAFSVLLVAHSGGAGYYDDPDTNGYYYRHTNDSPQVAHGRSSKGGRPVGLCREIAVHLECHVLRVAYKNRKCKRSYP